jgi:hypothetical protein
MRSPSAKKPKDKPANLRPRYEPATLEDAFFAAEGLTDDREQQLVIAAELMAMPVDEVRAKADAFFKASAKRVVVETGRRSGGAVVVETKAPRRIVVPPRAFGGYSRSI